MTEVLDNLSRKRVNHFILIQNYFFDLFVLSTSIWDYFNRGTGLKYLLVVSVFIMLFAISATVIYYKNPSSYIFRKVTVLFYFLTYLVILFNSNNPFAYVLVFPILTTYLLYFNLKAIIITSSGIAIANIAHVLYRSLILGTNTSLDLYNFSWQLFSIIGYTLVLVITTKVSNKFNKDKLSRI
jgi:hypothetical protein